ncbi:hypothetical protein [Chitinophaga silvisoli]|uniref:Uncharacterized protein n=1 Tax=Chitinophaga silvisoli TaxID=2291814 RepID=A0A3E1P5G7_9BACT|nr:hypothetical protein [Chitinophaga silvisoli]RFM35431.1 hypothetical protein DXN04_08560 [Chitinophaga silvisoli]
MHTIGKFKITEAFRNKQQKEILVGNLLEGNIAVGNFISIKTATDELVLKILDMEKGITVSGISFTGLVIECNDQLELAILRNIEIDIKAQKLP